MSSLTEIAEDILANARKMDAYTNTNLKGGHESLVGLPANIENARLALINSTQTLKRLALGPKGTLMEILYSFTDLISLRAIYTYSLPKYVPLEGFISFAEISRSTGIEESLLRRFFHHAMTNSLFVEPSPGFVAHTTLSRMLLINPDAFDALGFVLEELIPASNQLLPALAKYSNSSEPNETAFNIENKTSLSMFDYLALNPERAQRLGAGMKFFTQGEGFDVKHLIAGNDWRSLDHPGAVVVDMGGGHGAVSQALASATTNITFIVQDLAGTVNKGASLLPDTLQGRVQFMKHDFFTEQVIKNADVYFFRWVFHNWSDTYCVQILQKLIPAMKKGGKVMLYEYALAENPETKISEKLGRDLDLVMLSLFNSSERTLLAWRNVFALADPRFVLADIRRPEGSTMSVIEAVWIG